MTDPIPTASQRRRLIVGVADMKCGQGEAGGQIVTHALGSCIGLTVWDPVTKVGGMLHYMLAQSSDRAKAERSPFMYATSGIPALFREVYRLGGTKERLIVCAAGGSEILDDKVGFGIGKRNHTMMRKLFWKNGIAIHAEDTGGCHARHLTLDLETGTVSIRIKSEDRILWPR